MPSPFTVVSRRRVLLGTTALAAAVLGASACGKPPPPPELEGLVAQLGMAKADSQLAADAASRALAPQARALTTIASERTAHAKALSDELIRLVGTDAPELPATESSGQPATATAPPAAPATADTVAAALHRSGESAAGLAATFSGYRAGLLGSIAAACTAAYTVALPISQPAP